MNVDNVSILTLAKLGENPSLVKQNKKVNIAITVVLSGMIGFGIAFLLEYLDTTFLIEDIRTTCSRKDINNQT